MRSPRAAEQTRTWGAKRAASADYEYTHATLVTGAFQDQGKCSNGRQSMKSKAPFTATVWGWGSVTFGPSDVYTAYVSYAYPAGMGTKLINTVEIPVVK